MYCKFIVLALSSHFLLIYSQNVTCGVGREFTSCGSACPPTCNNPNPKCNTTCVQGCFCTNGTVRDDNNGKCVPFEQCTCGDGRVFKTCGSNCPPTCNNPNPSCNQTCVTGCFCQDGTVRDESNNTCVPLDQCQCSNGRVFTNCGSKCPPTCSNPNPSCNKTCVPGCFCPPGTVRDDNKGNCLSLKQCTCAEGRVFDTCGSNCPPTCSNPNPSCAKTCVAGCFCANGTVRDENNNNKCVPLGQCKCVNGRVFTNCGSKCPPTCSSPNPSCDKTCVPGCFCPPGTVRDDNNKSNCVPLNQCTCAEGRVFKTCGSLCPPTCSNPNPSCNNTCVAGCFCPNGTVRDENNNNQCVPFDQCKCVNGREFTTCGSKCPPACSNPNPSCDKTCVPGCYCPVGTVRDDGNNNGSCVPLEQCTCAGIRVFKICGSNCPPTCSNPNPVCANTCVAGCFCPKGTVRDTNNNNQCVYLNQCKV